MLRTLNNQKSAGDTCEPEFLAQMQALARILELMCLTSREDTREPPDSELRELLLNVPLQLKTIPMEELMPPVRQALRNVLRDAARILDRCPPLSRSTSFITYSLQSVTAAAGSVGQLTPQSLGVGRFCRLLAGVDSHGFGRSAHGHALECTTV